MALAGDVDAFVDRMPPIWTQQQEIVAKLIDIRREKRMSKDGPANYSIQTPQVGAAKTAPISNQIDGRGDDHGRDSGRER